MAFARRALVVAAAAWLACVGAYWLDPRPLSVPVAGLPRRAVRSSFGAPRDGGRRRHQGADLFARRGTPVLAAAAGIVVFRGTTPRDSGTLFVISSFHGLGD